MSAALEGLDGKGTYTGYNFFLSELNDIALVNNDLINEPSVALRFYRRLCHRLIKSVDLPVFVSRVTNHVSRVTCHV